jgi:hypothetical protein
MLVIVVWWLLRLDLWKSLDNGNVSCKWGDVSGVLVRHMGRCRHPIYIHRRALLCILLSMRIIIESLPDYLQHGLLTKNPYNTNVLLYNRFVYNYGLPTPIWNISKFWQKGHEVLLVRSRNHFINQSTIWNTPLFDFRGDMARALKGKIVATKLHGIYNTDLVTETSHTVAMMKYIQEGAIRNNYYSSPGLGSPLRLCQS